MNNELQNAYARGYAAGRKRKAMDRQKESLRRQRQAFWDRAFVACLPACINASGWSRGDKPIVLLDDRVKLAVEAADEALLKRKCIR